MKKWIFILFISVIIILFIRLVPFQLSLKNKIIINVPIEVVYSHISNIESLVEPAWNPWVLKSKNNQFNFVGIPGIVGGRITYEGGQIGKGTLTLTELSSPSLVAAVIDTNEPGTLSIKSFWRLKEVKEGTLVSWLLESNPTYIAPLTVYRAQNQWAWFTSEYLSNLKRKLEENSDK